MEAGQLYLFEGGTHNPSLRINRIGTTVKGEAASAGQNPKKNNECDEHWEEVFVP